MKIIANNFSVRYGEISALRGISIEIRANEIFAVIGPANSGKTSFLRCLNRINDLSPHMRVTGELLYDGIDLYSRQVNVPEVRRRLGMVFAVPLPLPGSIYHNLTLGPRMNGVRNRSDLEKIVNESLSAAYLWDEVKDRLSMQAANLSGGQQQRLCLARTLALQPDVLLLDEPCSGLDPISTAKIEEALVELKKRLTILLVTNNVMQASRVSDRTAFFLQGEMIECGETAAIFTNPVFEKTRDYISGNFG